MEFCKAFNAETQNMEKGLPIPVVITVYSDKSFTFIKKTPPATVLLKKAAGIQSGSAKPHLDKVGKVTRTARGDREGQDGGPECARLGHGGEDHRR